MVTLNLALPWLVVLRSNFAEGGNCRGTISVDLCAWKWNPLTSNDIQRVARDMGVAFRGAGRMGTANYAEGAGYSHVIGVGSKRLPQALSASSACELGGNSMPEMDCNGWREREREGREGGEEASRSACRPLRHLVSHDQLAGQEMQKTWSYPTPNQLFLSLSLSLRHLTIWPQVNQPFFRGGPFYYLLSIPSTASQYLPFQQGPIPIHTHSN